MKIKTTLVLAWCVQLMFCASPQTKIEKIRKMDPLYQYNLGLAYLNSGQLDKAEFHLKESISLEPNNYLAYNALGNIRWMRGNLDESVQFFMKSLEINPRFTEARNNLGISYHRMGLTEMAEKEFLAAIEDEKYRSRHNPLYNLAKLYFDQKKLLEALEYAQDAVEKKNDFVDAYFLIGQILTGLNRIDEAIVNYEKSVKIAPGQVELKFYLAEAYFMNRQFQKAKQIFNEIHLKMTSAEIKKKIEDYLAQIK